MTQGPAQPSTSVVGSDRLFVPVTKAWYQQFESGGKTWAVRRRGRQWTNKHIYKGRRVEIRCGYSGGRSVWGAVGQVIEVGTIRELFKKVSFHKIDTSASIQSEAIYGAIDEFFRLCYTPTKAIDLAADLIAFEFVSDKNKVSNPK